MRITNAVSGAEADAAVSAMYLAQPMRERARRGTLQTQRRTSRQR